MDKHNFSIQDAKQLDLVAYLEQLGHAPTKFKNNNYWYRSPLRHEKTASFKINKSLNCWFDFGLGEGGSIIDFGIRYFNCSVTDFLGRLNTKHIQQLTASVEGLKTTFNSNQLSNKVQELSARLTLAIGLLQKPVENKVNHLHHVPKLIWITAGLFIVLSLVCSGWYMTSEKSNGFVANDTKFRKLKLDSANQRLQSDLEVVDSLYRVNPDIREIVIRTEEENKRNLEMLMKVSNMENEANELKRKVLKNN